MMMGGEVLILLGIVALVVYLAGGFRSISGQGQGKRNAPGAEEILAQRFARGEISADEFEERLRVLESR